MCCQVVCHQLGYNRATRVTTSAEFGRGHGTIWIDNIHCTGLENHLGECDHNGWGVNNCRHNEDAGVICEGGHYLEMQYGVCLRLLC